MEAVEDKVLHIICRLERGRLSDRTCALTTDMDEYLYGDWKKCFLEGYSGGTYLCENKRPGEDTDTAVPYIIRFPGASRGYIITDKDNIITDIVFHQDTCYSRDGNVGCYTKDMEILKEKYIGYRLEVDAVDKL